MKQERQKQVFVVVALVLLLMFGAGVIQAALVTDIDNCRLWLDASEPNNITVDGNGKVILWKDLSGWGMDFHQDSAIAPTFQEDTENEINGNPIVWFENGTESSMVCDEEFTPDVREKATFFAVYYMDKWNNNQPLLGKGRNSNFELIMRSYFSSQGTLNENNFGFWGNGAVAEGKSWSCPINAYAIIEYNVDFSRESDKVQFYKFGGADGTSDAITSARIPDDQPMVLGALWDDTGYYYGLMGGICEVIFYADALGEEDRNRVGYYLQEKYGIVGSYSEYPDPEPKPALTNLIPDDFEGYGGGQDPNVVSLSSRWSSDGTISIEAVETHEGSGQSMKAVVSAGDKVVKESLRPVDYSEHDGKAAIIWFKGDAGNAGGDVTFRVISDAGVVVGSDTRVGGMTIADWTILDIPVEVDPADPNMWFSNAKVELEMSAAGTVYFDDLTFIVPVDVADPVLLWELDSSSGAIAEDSTSSGIDGVLSGFADTDWIVDGGDSGQAGDNALRFSGDPAGNQMVQAENVILTGSLDNIFEGESSWTMNQWLYLNSADTGFTAGGFGNGSEDGTRRWLINWGDGDIGFHGMGEVANIDTGVAYDVSSWQMITVTYDKWTKEVNIFKNAELISTTIGVLLFDTESIVRIGDSESVDYPSPNGLVDDFAIWDGVLPQSDEDGDAANDILSIYGSYTCDEANTFPADLTADCRVDMADLAAMAAEWLNCMRVPADFCL